MDYEVGDSSKKALYLFLGVSWILGIIFLITSYFVYSNILSYVGAFLLLMIGSNIVSTIGYFLGCGYAASWSPLAYAAPVVYLFGYSIVQAGVFKGTGLYTTWLTDWFFIVNLALSIIGATVVMFIMFYAKNPWANPENYRY